MSSSHSARYLVPNVPVDECFEHEIEVKRSRFLTFITRVSSRSEAIAFQQSLKQRFPDASHHCLAFVAGAPGSSQQGFDDDGEPSGTAGKPMLNVLQHKELGELVAVVVRWFGGIKLGAGGLVRAYGAAVQAACDHLPVIEMVPFQKAEIKLGYEHEQQLRYVLEKLGGVVIQADYSDQVAIQVAMPQSDKALFEKKMNEGCNGQVVIHWQSLMKK